MGLAFDYMVSNAIETESDYPYKAYDNKCAYDPKKGIAKTTGHVNPTPKDPVAL